MKLISRRTSALAPLVSWKKELWSVCAVVRFAYIYPKNPHFQDSKPSFIMVLGPQGIFVYIIHVSQTLLKTLYFFNVPEKKRHLLRPELPLTTSSKAQFFVHLLTAWGLRLHPEPEFFPGKTFRFENFTLLTCWEFLMVGLSQEN